MCTQYKPWTWAHPKYQTIVVAWLPVIGLEDFYWTKQLTTNCNLKKNMTISIIVHCTVSWQYQMTLCWIVYFYTKRRITDWLAITTNRVPSLSLSLTSKYSVFFLCNKNGASFHFIHDGIFIILHKLLVTVIICYIKFIKDQHFVY